MKLIKLELQNFQGIRRFALDAYGENCTIYGTNGVGKTTIANALTWLLFDKPYTGEKGYTPKTVGEDGRELHHLDHKASAAFMKEDGSQVTLTKVFHEVWKKKRGSATEEFSGHVTDAYIDGVPVSTKEYRTTLDAMCPPEKAKVLTDPRYFAKTMRWDDRRKILLEICGDVTDDEVIDSNPALSDLRECLRKPGGVESYTVDEYQRIAASRKAELNRELTIIPARIDETLKSIPDLDGVPDEEIITRQINTLERQKMDLMTSAAVTTEDDRARELHRQIDDITNRILKGRIAYREGLEFKNRTYNDEIRELGKTIAAADADMAASESRARHLADQIDSMKREREQLLRRHAEVKARAWHGDTICPACGQPMPENKIQEAMERFNVQRSRELTEINELGQRCSKSAIAELEDRLAAVRAATDEAVRRKEQAAAKLEKAKAVVESDPAYEDTEEYAALQAEKAAVAAKLAEAGTDTAQSKEAARAAVEALTRRVEELQEKRLLHVTARDRRARLAELEKQEKDIAAEYERFEHGAYLCEEFTRTKVSMLDERINIRFKSVRFRLFKTQINGGIADCCDVLCPTTSGLIPYDSANNAAQIQAGCEIAGILSRHWGLDLPMVIDNAEAIVGPINTDAQVIRLVVSEKDKHLRIELDDAMNRQIGAA